ncbi:endodeoxyribonuclease RusA [Prevotella sp. CAG:1320]|nr:endodeoxyribonuclease RusA [Prevotella sp. CAG:1320]
MEYETIFGQIVAKANHYLAVPDREGGRRIIKDGAIRTYERDFIRQCTLYKGRRLATPFRLFARVWHGSMRYDLDNSIKTLLDCLQMAGAIVDDKLCVSIQAEKRVDKFHPRVEYALQEIHEETSLFT